MLVKEIVQAIESKELSIKQLADQYKVSDRTIQTKIKKIGLKWHPSKAVYEFIGDDASVLESSFDSLFNKPQATASNSPNKSKSPAKSRSNSKSKSTSRDTSTNSSKSEIDSTSKEIASTIESLEYSPPESPEASVDIIDVLLSGKNLNSRRVYRGFYFDRDVLSIVDRAGNKSELINQALRKVFKDKGLL